MRLTLYPNKVKVTNALDYEIIDTACRFRKSGYQHADAYKSGRWDGYTRLYNKRDESFPIGLKDRVVRFYKKAVPHDSVLIEDKRSFRPPRSIPKIETVALDGVTLRPPQIRACKAMIKSKHGILWAATNSGKTEAAIAVLAALDLPAVFLVKGKELLSQTYERFKKRLGPTHVGIISSTQWKPSKFTIASADTLSRRLTQCPRTDKAKKRYRDVKAFITSVDVMVIDECHTAASDGLYRLALECTAPYRFGLSGTPFKRGDNQDLKLLAITGEVCCRITNKEMIEHGVSVPTDIQLIPIDIPIVTSREYVEVYEEGIIHNHYRNATIIDTALQHVKSGKQVLIIIKNIKHGNILSDCFKDRKEASYVSHQFIHGSSPVDHREQSLKNFKDGLVKVLITSSILDQGVDIPCIDVLIFAASGKSYIKSIQRIGRGLRLGDNKDRLLVIDFCDTIHKYLSKHSLERIKTYQSEGCFDIKVGAC